MGSIAYRIIDTGAGGGITISPHPLQRGAAKVAAANNIQHIRLDPSSTVQQWRADIENMIMMGFTDTVSLSMSESISFTVRDKHGQVTSEFTIDG